MMNQLGLFGFIRDRRLAQPPLVETRSLWDRSNPFSLSDVEFR